MIQKIGIFILSCLIIVSTLFSGKTIAVENNDTPAKDDTSGNIGIKMNVNDPIGSQEQVNVHVELSADAGSIVDTNGLMSVYIPKEIYSTGDISDLHTVDDAFEYVNLENPANEDPNYIKVNIKPNAKFNENSAWSASFNIIFQAPLIREDTTLNPEQTFKVTYNGQEVSQTVKIKPDENGDPSAFEKWWKGPVDSNQVGLLNTKQSQYNTYHLAVNPFQTEELNNVNVKDVIPEGLQIDPNPVKTNGINASDSLVVDGIRIIKVHNDGSRVYVTSQFKNNISYDVNTRLLNVTFDHVNITDSYLIEYKVNVVKAFDSYKNTATLTSDEFNKSDSILARLDGNDNYNKILTKSVNKTIVTNQDTRLNYTLNLAAITGTINKGQTFTDKLDDRLTYIGIVEGNELFNVSEKDNLLTITAKKDIPIGTDGSISFEVDTSKLIPGDSVSNKAYIQFNNGNFSSNTVTTKKIDGSVVLKKTNGAGKLLSGAQFNLLNGNNEVIDSGISNTDGEVTFHNLLPGNYQIIETKAPNGYELDTRPISFEVNNNSVTPILLEMENKLVKGALHIVKQDSASKQKLSGAEFKLVSEDGDIHTGLTDEKGELLFDNLAPGEYNLTEVKAPIGYELDQSIHKVTISGEKSDTVELTIDNKEIRGAAKLIKKDSQDGSLLKDVHFKLVDGQGNTVLDDLVTNEDGEITVSNLKIGNYAFVETKTQDGYILDESITPFEITDRNYTKNIELVKYNDKMLGSVQLEKLDEDNKKPISQTHFKLINSNTEEIISDLVTDQDGKLIINYLPIGEYSLIETKSNPDYIMNTSPVNFKITKENYSTTVKLVKYNKKKIETTGSNDSGADDNPNNSNDVNHSPDHDEQTHSALPSTGDIVGFSVLIGVILVMAGMLLMKRGRNPRA
ncbi:collagen adhesion protein [Listeria fleischmannii 1991]|uniref:Collagen adhesion protein n=1 Tax=Listeria fleischmannii 1991 TaxID=1430899 RepID=A0A0J8GFH6_9LIST|nr:SpaA isopeptide-forming pilin-related protein [Listeria fleischmannii]KMT61422.1 collagen adhesion protein [Listeria fleischmannii 1991]